MFKLHGEHVADPKVEKKPRLQGVQLVESAEKMVLGGQTHADAPTPEVKLGGQGIHAALDVWPG